MSVLEVRSEGPWPPPTCSFVHHDVPPFRSWPNQVAEVILLSGVAVCNEKLIPCSRRSRERKYGPMPRSAPPKEAIRGREHIWLENRRYRRHSSGSKPGPGRAAIRFRPEKFSEIAGAGDDTEHDEFIPLNAISDDESSSSGLFDAGQRFLQ